VPARGGLPQPLPASAGNGCAVFSAFGAEERAEKIHPSNAPVASQVLSGRQHTKKLIPLPDNVPRFPV
ncbi:hypothetical protein KQI10_02965, partial [Pseudoflavonifractor sp. MSJ-30]|uniref:hypothetical protein n=1 Tax=Pseudoflavonifractor sp. MSJ-30 TaxID=2841525 RepID=UPI001C0F4697